MAAYRTHKHAAMVVSLEHYALAAVELHDIRTNYIMKTPNLLFSSVTLRSALRPSLFTLSQ